MYSCAEYHVDWQRESGLVRSAIRGSLKTRYLEVAKDSTGLPLLFNGYQRTPPQLHSVSEGLQASVEHGGLQARVN